MIHRLLNFLICFAAFLPVGAQVSGCTDPLAQNYDPLAMTNDGTCVYAPTGISPYLTLELPTILSETSGLIDWDGTIWTHNDDTDIRLYALDPQDATITQECILAGITNQDWEDIDQDNTWIYVGDFGNNSSGNRQNLHILRIEKATLCSGQPLIDTLWFSYEDQTDFGNQGSNNSDFDCESMVVGADSIYLFTKQWKSLGTSVYTLPKVPGDHTANLRESWPVNGLITGATWLEEKRLLALCGYSTLLQPFLYLCYDYPEHNFFSGNKRRVELTLPFHQIEGISTTDGLDYTISNERFSQIVMVPPRLHRVDLNDYLSAYLDGSTGIDYDQSEVFDLRIKLEGETIVINASNRRIGQILRVVDGYGKVVAEETLRSVMQRIEISSAPAGLYIVQVGNDARTVMKL